MIQEALRKAIESTYTDSCTVSERRKEINPVTKLTDWKDVVVLDGQPCRLSFKTVQSTQQEGAAEETVQSVKLFLSPDIVIKEGSKITVLRGGREYAYVSSGVPAAIHHTRRLHCSFLRGGHNGREFKDGLTEKIPGKLKQAKGWQQRG